MNESEKKRVLVVEDSVDDADLIVEALAEYREVADIDIVADGEEALDYLHRRGRFSSRPSGDPVVILLDIKMPKMDGIEVLRAVKSDARTASIPVVVLTSSREPCDVSDCYRSGANAYVVKSIGFDDFTKAMRGIGFFWLGVNEPHPPRAEAR